MKWSSKNDQTTAFALIGGKLDVRPPDAKTHLDFIDEDTDRFNVMVFDQNAAKQKAAFIDVKLSTVNVTGYEAYNDPATTIRLVPYREAAAGWYWSDSLILVSNEVDDKFNGVQIAVDEAEPGANTVAKHGTFFAVTDRTHRVALGGNVKVEYLGTTTVEAPVRVEKVVKLHVNILKDVGGVNGKAVIANADVWKDIAAMREIYAQLAIRVDVVDIQSMIIASGGKLSVVDPPGKVDLSNGLTEYSSVAIIVPSDEEKELLGDATIRSATVGGKDDIEVYYVNNLSLNSRGESFPASRLGAGDAKYADSVIVSTDKRNYGTLVHEATHIFENRPAGVDSHYPYAVRVRTRIDIVNLMVFGAVRVGDVVDSIRITTDQQDRISDALPRLIFGV